MKLYSKTLILLFFFIAGCISVDLKPKATATKSEFVAFNTPPTPFEEIKAPTGDKVWVSGRTGNTISYLSECNTNLDTKIDDLMTDATNFLNDRKEIETTVKLYNHRKSIQSLISGDVDGIHVKLLLIIFRKNQCTYTLTYGGVLEKFNDESQIFTDFVSHFRVTQ